MAIIDSILNKNGDIIYPKTLEKAIYDNDGVRLDVKLNNFVDNSRVLTDVPLGAKFTDTNTEYIAGENITIEGNIINASGGGGIKVVEMGDSDVIDLSLGNIFISRPITDKEYSIVNADGGYQEFKLYINNIDNVLITLPVNIIFDNNSITYVLPPMNIYNFNTINGGEMWYGEVYSENSYVLATDSDFTAVYGGVQRYTGTDEYVIIPERINGKKVVNGGASERYSYGSEWRYNYYGMFDKSSSSTVKGIATKKGHIINTQYMFYENPREIDKRYFNIPL